MRKNAYAATVFDPDGGIALEGYASAYQVDDKLKLHVFPDIESLVRHHVWQRTQIAGIEVEFNYPDHRIPISFDNGQNIDIVPMPDWAQRELRGALVDAEYGIGD